MPEPDDPKAPNLGDAAARERRARDARLAEEMRLNLLKRKAQARARRRRGDDPGPGPDDG